MEHKKKDTIPQATNIGELTTRIIDDQKIERLERYKKLNQFVIKGQILFIGSSLMEQFPINELQHTLKNKKHIIYNRGVGGFVTDELLVSMNTCIFELEPSKIFINIGTNDIASPNYKKENLVANYDRILREIKDQLPACKVYVMAYYPVNSEAYYPSVNETMKEELFQTRTNRILNEANILIKSLAQKHHYEFIDVNNGLVDQKGNLKEEYAVEGIHLWPTAYFVILNNLKKYL